MQPDNSRNEVSRFEQVPVAPVVGGEVIPTLPPFDQQLEKSGAERVEQLGEARAQAVNAIGSAPAPMPAVNQPAVADNSNVTNATSSQGLETPLIAADEDLIEKEWVDKAKEIIEQTSNDPYKRTKDVSQLQRDYLQKRYGKVLGADDNNV